MIKKTLPQEQVQKSTIFSQIRPEKPLNQEWQISLK